MKREAKQDTTCREDPHRYVSRDEWHIRENGGAELLDDPMLAQFCRIVGGKLAIREAQALDRCEKQVTAATYHLIAMILIRTAGNFLENWRKAGYALNQKAYNVASHFYNRAAFAMRQASLAELYSHYSRSQTCTNEVRTLRERTGNKK